MVPSNKKTTDGMTSMDKRGKGWSWTTMTMATAILSILYAKRKSPKSASELRIVQSADTDILDQGGILSPLAHKRTDARDSTSGTTRANLEPFCKHFEK